MCVARYCFFNRLPMPSKVPEVFEKARLTLASNIIHWGYAPSKEEFLRLLRRSDVAVSTAFHEFYGVAMLESAFSGALPLAPNRLSYPELLPRDCIYNTRTQLVKRYDSRLKHIRSFLVVLSVEFKIR